MNNYRTGRWIATLIAAAGWVAAAISAFFFVFRLARTDIAQWATATPFFLLLLGSLSLVLLSWIARAVFDLACVRGQP